MLKAYNIALAYESCIDKTVKESSQNDSIHVRWEANKEILHNAANTLQRNKKIKNHG